MATVLAVLKIKLHIIWHSGHMLIVRPLLLTTFAFPYKLDFLAGTITCAIVASFGMAAQAWNCWYLQLASYSVMPCLIPHLLSLPFFWWMPPCPSPTYHRIKGNMKKLQLSPLGVRVVVLVVLICERYLYQGHEWRSNAQVGEYS